MSSDAAGEENRGAPSTGEISDNVGPWSAIGAGTPSTNPGLAETIAGTNAKKVTKATPIPRNL